MKSITLINRLADRLMALFANLFSRQRGSDKFRVLANKKPLELNKQQPLKISQSHW